MGERAYTSSSYFVSPLFCIYSFCERVFLVYYSLSLLLCWACSGIFYAPLSVLFSRSELVCLGFVGIAFHHRWPHPFSDTPLTISAIRFTSSQYPCRMIWFEEILKGSCSVVLCPRSGEGYFGLARRTYSLQCPPDIAAVRLFRFTLRFCG